MRHDRGVLARGRWLLAAVLLACCALGAFAPAARADGDPASDVLVYQNLFVTSESGMSTGQQAELASLLASAAHAGFPVRVAIIARRSTWARSRRCGDKPAAYASFLGIELSLVYKQRLLIVMPNGFGFNWPGHPSGPAYQVLSQVAHRRGRRRPDHRRGDRRADARRRLGRQARDACRGAASGQSHGISPAPVRGSGR